MNKLKQYLNRVLNNDILILTIAKDHAFDEYSKYLSEHQIDGYCYDLKDAYERRKEARENAIALLEKLNDSIIIDDEKLMTALSQTAKTHKVSVEELIFIILYDYLEIE